MRPHRLAHVLQGRRRVEAVELGAGRIGVPVREVLGRPADRERFERQADLEQVTQLLDVEVEDAGALVRHVLGQAERLQLAHRLANRRDRHAERPGELVEPERRPRRELPHDDRLAQLLERVFRHRPVPHRPLGVPRHVPSEDTVP